MLSALCLLVEQEKGGLGFHPMLTIASSTAGYIYIYIWNSSHSFW